MPHDKEGNKLTWKEFMQRWKKGIAGVTALQQVKMQMNSMYIITIGLFLGLIISLIGYKDLWWLGIILAGGLFNTGVMMIGVYQKKMALERMENYIIPAALFAEDLTAEEVVKDVEEGIENERHC